jgi:tetratricopeptide (TPR) repeat protein
LKDSYILQRQAPAAVQKIKEYAAQQPKSAAVQDFLGFVMWGSGDRVAARTAFTAATAADPKYYPADLALVQLDALDGNWDDATLKLNGLLAANPGNATARLWLGTIQAIKGNPAAALENFRKVVEISPDNSQALNNFAYLLLEHANKPDEALKYAEKAVEEAPTNANYADTLGWILYRKGLYSQALSNLERAVSTGRSPVAKYHLAMAYAKAGDLQRGRVTLAAAIKQNSKLPEARMAAEVLGPVK